MHGISKALSTYLVNVKSCDYLVKSDVEIVQEIYNLHSKEDIVDDKLHYYMARRAWGNLGVLVGCYQVGILPNGLFPRNIAYCHDLGQILPTATLILDE